MGLVKVFVLEAEKTFDLSSLPQNDEIYLKLVKEFRFERNFLLAISFFFFYFKTELLH